jgi:hypothetical protein
VQEKDYYLKQQLETWDLLAMVMRKRSTGLAHFLTHSKEMTVIYGCLVAMGMDRPSSSNGAYGSKKGQSMDCLNQRLLV